MKLLRRFLVSNGAAGGVPRWYRLMKAAQYLGTTPWELEHQSWDYVRQAEEAQDAEAYATNNQAPGQ